MSEALQGVLIGGILASVGTTATLMIQYGQWRKTKLVEHYRLQSSKLETLFQRVFKEIGASMVTGTLNTETFADILCACPKKVREAYETYVAVEGKSSPDVKREHYLLISLAMKESLADIDKKIELELK